MPAKARVFVSYSHKDRRFLTSLEDQLKLLERKGYVGWWTDKEIIPGDDWRATIGSALDDANIILLLISIHFLASDFCWEVELQRAIERHEEGSARVVPIFVRSCRWQETPIEVLQGVPSERPIQKWADKHEAWAKVAEGIERAVTKWRESLKDGT